MKKFLATLIGVLVLANVIQYCQNSNKEKTIELQNKKIDCFQKCQSK